MQLCLALAHLMVKTDELSMADDAETARSRHTGKAKSMAGTTVTGQAQQGRRQAVGRALQEGGEPMDLLDSGLARRSALAAPS